MLKSGSLQTNSNEKRDGGRGERERIHLKLLLEVGASDESRGKREIRKKEKQEEITNFVVLAWRSLSVSWDLFCSSVS
jgi:hypothetical protein